MDHVVEGLSAFVFEITPQDLPPHTVHQVKRRIVDTVGCMIGGSNRPPALIGRRLAGRTTGTPSATVLGSPTPATLDMATFANSVMARYLDFNDTTITSAGGGGHFSDMIPGLLATAEATGASGADVVLAVALAYEIAAALASVERVRERGWDYATWLGIATALSAGKMLGLTRAQLGHATSIAAVGNIATRQMRVGELSMWKGAATAAANRNGIFAALLAREGMTGPAEPFAGKDGIMDLITGRRFTLDLDAGHRPDPWQVELSNFKIFPSGYNTQGPGALMLGMRERIPVDEIDEIAIQTYWLCYSENGMEPAKFDPQVRETADHSLPYVVAIALVDGAITLDSFAPARFTDPALRPLLKKIVVTENPDYTRRFPDELCTDIAVRLRSGAVVRGETTHAYGHWKNPPTDEAINQKFEGLAGPADDIAACRRVRDICWSLDTTADLREFAGLLGRVRLPGPVA